MNKLAKIGRIYRYMLCKHPIITQSIQTGLLMASGDVIAQKIIEKRCELNSLRTAQFFALGTVVVGPAVTVWYKLLSRLITDRGKSAALKKMALDQLIFAPTFLAVFIALLNSMQGKDLDFIKKELSCKYKDILISNYKLWPTVQLVNFYMVPLMFQVLFTQIVALIWNAYLSWKTQQGVADKDGEEDDDEDD
ncbi:protein Mpv17 [Anoplophora glabripennis]|uniref:protein Mpv17 n=1 Tax=Anoplophora glabripennis TaxID=217634 RepID=UPI000874929F|nr:protein Mpv17 [Anoplophora glabripennis]